MELKLERTRLVYRDGVLSKHGGKDDNIVSRFSISDIADIRIENRTDYTIGLIIGLSFLALAFVAKQYIPSQGWSWVGAILCLAVCGFSVLISQIINITIETTNGSIRYQISDPPEDAEGFVLSMKYILGEETSADKEDAGSTEGNADEDSVPDLPV
jgi:hypothetical protein